LDLLSGNTLDNLVDADLAQQSLRQSFQQDLLAHLFVLPQARVLDFLGQSVDLDAQLIGQQAAVHASSFVLVPDAFAKSYTLESDVLAVD
jgi:hypothetical protein